MSLAKNDVRRTLCHCCGGPPWKPKKVCRWGGGEEKKVSWPGLGQACWWLRLVSEKGKRGVYRERAEGTLGYMDLEGEDGHGRKEIEDGLEVE